MVSDGRLSSTERRAFAQRLRTTVEQSGLTYDEIARRAREQLPSDSRLSGASVWQYAHGKTFPRQRESIAAIAAVLGVEPDDLLAPGGEPSPFSEPTPGAPEQPHVRVEDLGNGRARLIIATETPWSVALKILEMLTADAAAKRGE